MKFLSTPKEKKTNFLKFEKKTRSTFTGKRKGKGSVSPLSIRAVLGRRRRRHFHQSLYIKKKVHHCRYSQEEGKFRSAREEENLFSEGRAQHADLRQKRRGSARVDCWCVVTKAYEKNLFQRPRRNKNKKGGGRKRKEKGGRSNPAENHSTRAPGKSSGVLLRGKGKKEGRGRRGALRALSRK